MYKHMSSREIRREFLSYFSEKGHAVVPSSSLVPAGDPTLLFTNAGMVQFKDVFLGIDSRAYKRAVTDQKCLRAGGKHNDLENVGFTARHHTFFEMLGNFSFGDYFKEEAIEFAWEFVNGVLGIPREVLWVTVYQDDTQSADLWQEVAGIPKKRIVALGGKDNFWAMGETGPCGPCTEILVDRGADKACGARECAIGKCDCDRWLEIWNLVFMQYNRDKDGTMTPLPRPSVDTGMGLERVSSILQGVDTNFDTDLFKPIISFIESLSGQSYKDEAVFPFRVIADHARACTFLACEGVFPSNEGRGYVMRRILRRAVRFGRHLGIEGPFLHKIVGVIKEVMGDAYPELVEKTSAAEGLIATEEERFLSTLDNGLRVATGIVKAAVASGKDAIDGKDAFMLYDTFGFPIDLMEDIARENDLKVDREGFEEAMAAQREKGRVAHRARGVEYLSALDELCQDLPPTTFVGYDSLESHSRVLRIILAGENEAESVELAGEGKRGYIVLNESPFYAESGGQIGDKGEIVGDLGRARVIDVKRLPGNRIVHEFLVEKGLMSVGGEVRAVVDAQTRSDTARNHTATHLLHASLRKVLGEHVAQAGSLVTPDRLRFDFTHSGGLSGKEIQEIEDMVNAMILSDVGVKVYETDLERARTEGAIALFGEKYGDRVRVAQIGEFSKELCGGTHVSSTGMIGLFKITGETGIGSGIRRIEAVTGRGSLQLMRETLETIATAAAELNAPKSDLQPRLIELMAKIKEQERKIEELSANALKGEAEWIASRAIDVSGIKVASARVSTADPERIRTIGDMVKDRLGSCIVVLAGGEDGKVQFVAMVTRDLVKKGYNAGTVVRETARLAGGSGGGRPEMAQAGAKDISKVDMALGRVCEIVERLKPA